MGNVVVSEALRFSRGFTSYPLFRNYIATQAATVADSYSSESATRVVGNSKYPYTGGLLNWFVANNSLLSRFYYNDELIADPVGWRSLPNRSPIKHGEIPDWYSFESIDENNHPLSPGELNIDIAPRFMGIQEAISGDIINYYNRTDYALEGWEFNTMSKPDNGSAVLSLPSWEYEREVTLQSLTESRPEVLSNLDTQSFFSSRSIAESDIDLSFDSTQYGKSGNEIIAYIVPSRSLALGVSRIITSDNDPDLQIIDTECNLGAFGFTNSPYDHSAQFLANLSMRSDYWKNMLSLEFGFGLVDSIVPKPC